MRNNTIIASIIGNTLEYYDYTLFAVFSVEIGNLFFPEQGSFSKVFLTLAVFAAGFLMRPFGAIIFGHIGDRYGRKKALTLSILCMAFPTFAIGLLPEYQTFGIWAPLLLVVLRLIQGVSIGGEGAGSAIFILEHNQDIKPGYLGGIIIASNFIGAFCATLVGLFVNTYTSSTVGWRYAFILGGILGFIGLYLRTCTKETPIFEEVVRKKEVVKLPLLKVLLDNKKQMVLSISLGGIVGAFANIILAYINLFFNKMIGLSTFLSLTYTSLSIGSFMLFLPLFGYWSDKIGYIRSIIQACCITIITVIPIFMMMSSDNLILHIISILSFSSLGAWICAPSYPIMLQIFLPQQRYSGISFSFNIGVAFMGGTAPIIAAFLTKLTGLTYAPSFYLLILATMCLGCYYFIYEKISLVKLKTLPAYIIAE